MRINVQFKVDLKEKYSPEDSEINLKWRVKADAFVTTIDKDWQNPGEQLVEDIVIYDVTEQSILYGTVGFTLDVRPDRGINQGTHDVLLRWLQSQLKSGDRDRWVEELEKAAIQAAESKMFELREVYVHSYAGQNA